MAEQVPFSVNDVLEFNIRSLPHLEMANRATTIASAFLAHPGYQTPFPPELLHPKEVIDLCGKYTVASNAAAATGDRGKREERDSLRPMVAFYTEALVHWGVVRSVRENDPSLIANLTLDSKKKAARKATPPVTGTPTVPKLRHGNVSGTMLVTVGKIVGGSAYFVAITQGDPTVEENWSQAGEFNRCRNLPITGLEPGKVYHFRVRCLGAGGYSAWSSVATLMAM